MSRRLTKELVLQWLKEAAGWEAGHNELFEYKHWSLGIHKEDDSYQPFTFGVAGHHKGTAETIAGAIGALRRPCCTWSTASMKMPTSETRMRRLMKR